MYGNIIGDLAGSIYEYGQIKKNINILQIIWYNLFTNKENNWIQL